MIPISFKNFLNEDAGKTLYMRRNLVNSDEFLAWAKEQGFTQTVTGEELHVTLCFSKGKVDWNKITPDVENYTSKATNRKVIPLGDKGAKVLMFADSGLKSRWKEIKDAGATWDYEDYNPHVTITYRMDDVDLSKVKPFEGDLVFGPEIMAELDENWAEKVKHDKIEQEKDDT